MTNDTLHRGSGCGGGFAGCSQPSGVEAHASTPHGFNAGPLLCSALRCRMTTLCFRVRTDRETLDFRGNDPLELQSVGCGPGSQPRTAAPLPKLAGGAVSGPHLSRLLNACPSSAFEQMAVLRFLDRVNAELRKLQSTELNQCELRGWLCKADQVFRNFLGSHLSNWRGQQQPALKACFRKFQAPTTVDRSRKRKH